MNQEEYKTKPGNAFTIVAINSPVYIGKRLGTMYGKTGTRNVVKG
ncbi:hypothetical protein [Paenibacillus polymyxa]|nr:hypothetical protein [Paenibacillus polymyxa]